MAVIAGNPQVRHRPLHPLLSLVMLATLTASMRCTILACTCASKHGVDVRHSVPAEGSTTNSVVGCYPQVDAGSDASSDVLHDVYESPSLRAAQDRAQRMESFLALTQRVRPGGMAGECPCRSARQISSILLHHKMFGSFSSRSITRWLVCYASFLVLPRSFGWLCAQLLQPTASLGTKRLNAAYMLSI